ncbi:MAG: DPP IV N-terminal domain-containing protein, partial [Duncaniella sp.]|nr:DPP IV N-terminal domain-containing protein [Duncaniella sp.]
MKQYIFTAVITLLAAFAPTQAQAKANISEFGDLAPYVYPNNIARGVSRPAFSADGLSCLRLSDDHKRVVSFDIVTGKDGDVVMDVTHTRENTITSIDNFILSPDGTKLLVATGTSSIYRRSTSASYYIYELRTRILTPLSDTHHAQRSPLFSPDGRMVAFVSPADNNIYLKKLDYGTEVAVTSDGVINSIINGVPDWVYEAVSSTHLPLPTNSL